MALGRPVGEMVFRRQMVAKWAGELTIEYMISDRVICVDFGLHGVVNQQASNDSRNVHNWAKDPVEPLLTVFNHLLPLPPLPHLCLGPDSRLASRNHSHRYLVVR